MRILGLLFILFGLPLCFTLIWTMPGIAFVAVGALLRIAAHKQPPSRATRIVEGCIVGGFVLVILSIMIPAWLGVSTKHVSAAAPATVSQPVKQQTHKPKRHAAKPASQDQPNPEPSAQ